MKINIYSAIATLDGGDNIVSRFIRLSVKRTTFLSGYQQLAGKLRSKNSNYL